ncbi:hypothetical protein [Mycolicibacterium celeriflavum]|uniref:hypothetical protein n=1 Tax=Mycolicibacterium celeriflavum TaxID=1249101 RepID=UPI003CEB3D08
MTERVENGWHRNPFNWRQLERNARPQWTTLAKWPMTAGMLPPTTLGPADCTRLNRRVQGLGDPVKQLGQLALFLGAE